MTDEFRMIILSSYRRIILAGGRILLPVKMTEGDSLGEFGKTT